MYSPSVCSFSFRLHSSRRKHITSSLGFWNGFLRITYTTYNLSQQCVLLFLNYIIRIYRVIEKSHNPVWYLVPARNECDQAELVDEYVGATVQKLRKEKNTGHMTWRHLRSGFKPAHLPTRLFHKHRVILLQNSIFSLNPIWNAWMTAGVPSRGIKCQISPQYFL